MAEPTAELARAAARAAALDEALRGDSVAALADEGESGLWTLDEVAAWRRRSPARFQFPVPTYAPWYWPAPVCDQAEFTAQFARGYPAVAQILPIDGVHIASFTANPACRMEFRIITVVIVNEARAGTIAWDVIAEIADRLRAANGNFQLETLIPGAVLFAADSYRVRVVLCTFASLDDAVRNRRPRDPERVTYEGATVRMTSVSEQFVYDGVTTRMTMAAAYSYAFRVYPIREPQDLSTNALWFCDDNQFALALLPGAGPCEALRPDVVRGRFAAGKLPVGRAPYGSDVTWLSWMAEHNPTENPSMPDVLSDVWLLAAGRPGCFVSRAWGQAGRLYEGHPWREYAAGGPPYELTAQMLEGGLAAFAQLAVTPDGLVSATVLRHIYRMTDEQIGRFAGAVANAVATWAATGVAGPGAVRRFDAAPALAPFAAAIRAAHAAGAAAPVDWMAAPPARPAIPAEGAGAAPACAFGRAGCDPRAAWALDDAGLLAPECRAELVSAADLNSADRCCLCRGRAPPAPGVLTLPCGRRVHWGAAGACPGLLAVNRADCPACSDSGAPELPKRRVLRTSVVEMFTQQSSPFN